MPPRTKTPASANGQKILAYCLKTWGSIQKAARAADVPEPTLRRRIYENVTRVDVSVNRRLEAAGFRREWLAA